MPASTWYEDDAFWEQTAPLLFDEARAGSPPTQVDQIIHLLGLKDGADILDLCCGPGRHSPEFARRGFPVVGVDRTSGYLEKARAAAAEAGLEAEFVQEDVRAFQRPSNFDAAINMLSSFGYFEDAADNLRVLENIRASLKPGGRFVIDLMGKEILARIFQERDWRRFTGDSLLLEERKILDGWRTLESRWIFLRGAEHREFTIRLKLYSGAELAWMLRNAGFSEVQVYGGLDGGPYDADAKRLVAVGKK